MNNYAVIFKHKNKYYQTTNLNKKLKRLKVSENDIEIIFQEELTQSELEKKFLELTKKKKEMPHESWHNPKLYEFYNPKDKTTILSIYQNLNDLKNDVNINEYILKEDIEGNRN